MLIQATPSSATSIRHESDCLSGVQSGSTSVESCFATESRQLGVVLLTPWDQQCGNAEYAKRLAVGLREFASIQPIELTNFTDIDEKFPRRRRREICLALAEQANKSTADLVHVQHEFCFFGRGIPEANRNFRRMIRLLRKPLVITLHTWPARLNRRRRKHWWQNLVEAVRFRLAKRQMASVLHQAAALVVHSQETYQNLLTTYPKHKHKTFVIPIPIEPINHSTTVPLVRKQSGEKWVVLPGFVSRYKGHRHAIAALKVLPDSFRLVIAGGVHPKDRSGPAYWMQLLTDTDAAGIQDRVVFTGFIEDPKQQSAILHQADCFILPYAEVGQSGSAVLADALSHDKPVITSHAKSMFVYRGLPDTVFSSVAVDVTCPETFAGIIQQTLVDSPPGLPLSRKQLQAAREHFSLAKAKDQYKGVYDFALHGTKK